jgi:hypothetical protein
MPPLDPDLVSQITGAESSGNPNAQNRSTSAGGLGQFINSTWLDMLDKYRPEYADLSRGQKLQLKFDPDLSREMTGKYAEENGAYLTGKGLETTPGNLYLAHFAGPQGAAKALSVDPATPISQVMTPAALRANPFLATQGINTAGDLIAWAGRRVGQQGTQIAQGGGTGAQAVGGTVSSGAAPTAPAATATAPGGDISGLLAGLGNVGGAGGQSASGLAPPQNQPPLSFLRLAQAPQLPAPYFAPRGQLQQRQIAQIPARNRTG